MNTAAPQTTVAGRPADAPAARKPGLRREIGFIGLLWASAGSIIGSGWLFGAQKALIAAGPAAVISWCIGALAIFLLALTHAELGAKGVLSAISTSGIIFALLGFEQADQLAGESARPKRDIPRAVIFSVIIGAVIYVALQVVFLGALPHSQIGSTWAKGAYTTMTGPFAQVATLAAVGWLAAILYADAIISPGGTGLIYTTSSSRVSYGLSRNGYFPTVYESTDRRGVPWFGLITAFVVGCVCFLPFPSWTSLVGLITAASVLMYAGAPLAFGVFRRRLPNAERPWRAPAGPVLAPVAFVVAYLLILWAGWDTVWRLGVAITIGYVILAVTRIFGLNPRSPQLDLRAASWLPVYLLGMGAIVYLSDFGPMTNPVFPLWWDMVAVAIFSAIIYFWAMAVALPTERIEQMIGDVVLPEEEDIAASEPLSREV